eukprot:scaffold2695_cov256-Chaetoceros_neogracile.AAC.1
MADGINCCSVSPSKKRSLPNALWHDPYSDLSITNSTRPAAGSHEDHQVPSPQKRVIMDYDYECNESSNGDSNDYDCDVTNDNDESSLSRDLEMTPSYGGITQRMKELTLQEETGDELQNKAIALAMQGKNVFLTGKAGTGKSWTTRKIVMSFEQQQKTMHVTASSGIAAINVNGVTIHSWGGFGIGEYYSDFDRMMDKKTSEKIRKTKALLIDEISMLDGHLFDVLECMVSIIRCYGLVEERLALMLITADGRNITSEETGGVSETKRESSIVSPYMLEMRWKSHTVGGLDDIPAWGGLQLIVVGDFFQLPPVPNSRNTDSGREVLLENNELCETEYNLKIGRQGSYAFESNAWQRSKLHPVELEEVHRQAENDGLFELLNAMREGEPNLACKHRAALSALKSPLPKRSDGITPTELHSKNSLVNSRNRDQLKKLDGSEHLLRSLDEVEFDHAYKTKLLQKYNLEHFGHMPYLFASVEVSPPPPLLIEARNKLLRLEEQTKQLFDNDDYDALIPMKKQKDDLKAQIEAAENEEKEKSIISISSIQEFLNRGLVHGVPLAETDPKDIFQNFQRFQVQLKQDFEVLKEHADQSFFQKQCRVGQVIEMKEKAQVMLLWNLDLYAKLANGSRGIVEGFVSIACYRHLLEQEVKKRELKEMKSDNDAPRTPAKSNHSVGESANVAGASAVAGACTSTNDQNQNKNESEPIVEDYNYSMNPEFLMEIISYIENVDDLSRELKCMDKLLLVDMKDLPFVQFTNGMKRLILPQPFQREFKGCGHATRWQVPLSLAWAISIHKSQGMTIDWLHVDLKDCFSVGQAYVACSRGKSLKAMTVENFNHYEIKTSKKVQQFYKSGNASYPFTWSDTIAEFDKLVRDENTLEERMRKRYKSKVCKLCRLHCVVRQVHSNRSGNYGKWYIKCPENYLNGHTYEFVPVTPCDIRHS